MPNLPATISDTVASVTVTVTSVSSIESQIILTYLPPVKYNV